MFIPIWIGAFSNSNAKFTDVTEVLHRIESLSLSLSLNLNLLAIYACCQQSS